MEVEFFSSTSKQTLIIEQDGNWLEGSHKGEFSVRDLQGTLEGNDIKMKSSDRQIGDNITFMFSGTVKDNTMVGSIYMGEYMTAKFTAKRHTFKSKREKIMIPSGPPLAT